MKQIFENMIIIVLILLSLFINAFMIMSNLEITEARNFHAQAVEEIQASGFSPNVITEKINEANEHEVYGKAWKLYVSDNLSPYDDRQDRKVVLTYYISPLPIVGGGEARTIVGYAR